jgi:uncharacterized membrane protein YsdA (DUF1294 family)
MSVRVPAGRGLLWLYPLAWRRRYGDELAALLEDDPPSLQGLATLVTGALRAHARRGAWQSEVGSSERMRLSIWAVFCCWLGVSLAGAVFQKETEEQPFSVAVAHHGLLGVARIAVIAGAVLGAAAIALGGLPLLWEALRQARSPGRAVRIGLLLPLAGLALFAAVTLVVLAAAPLTLEGTSTGLRLALSVPWAGAGAVFALACAFAPRIVLMRLDPPQRLVQRASYAGVVLLAAMALVTAGLLAYCLALARLEPALSALSGGPLARSTGLVLGAGAALAALCTALAAVGATRALAAARV